MSRVVLVVCLLFVVVTATCAEVRYVLTDLGPVNSTGHCPPAQAINNSRQIVCCWDCEGPIYLWKKGVFRSLGMYASHSANKVTDINDAGQVLGTIAAQRAAIWQNGAVIDLGTPEDVESIALGINNNGQVVGALLDPILTPFVWQDGVFTELAPPGEISTRPYSINDSGTIVGMRNHQACVWTEGVTTVLNLPGNSSKALSINALGDIVGELWDDWHGTAFLYSGGIATVLGAWAGFGESTANAINNRGQIVGVCGSRPVLWEDGLVYDLNDLIAPASGFTLLDARDINDRGDIVGAAFASKGSWRAFLLTPWLMEVTIDVLPQLEPNVVYLNGRARVPVAVLTSDEFDSSSIDCSTVRFAGATPVRDYRVDIDGNGGIDAVFVFESSQLDLYSDSTRAELTGRTLEGRPFHGFDSIEVRGGSEQPVPLVPRYSMTLCELLPGTNRSGLRRMNSLGQIIGNCDVTPCFWDNGTPIELEVPGYGGAVDVNDLGQVLISSNLGKFVWQDGTLTSVAIPGVPVAINNDGCVAGWGGLGDTKTRGFIWYDGELTFLEPPYGDTSWATDINNSGTVAGQSDDEFRGGLPAHPCVWIKGAAQRLRLPAGYEGCAYGINDLGDVVGYCMRPDDPGSRRACLWRDGDLEILKQGEVRIPPYGPRSIDGASALNDWGQIVGWSASALDSHRPTLWHAGAPYRLSDLIVDLPERWACLDAADINNAGQIAIDLKGYEIGERAALLNPIPTHVDIDIRPGDLRNSISPGSHGMLPVAVFGGEGFVSSSLLPETVVLAGARPVSWSGYSDLNRDGRDDVVLMFRVDDLQLPDGISEIALKGRTFDGWWIEGSDRVDVQGGK